MPKRIIAVSSNPPPILAAAAEPLVTAGHELFEVSTAAEALEILERKSSSTLLITDALVVGSTTGFGLAREVARRWPHVPIIVCSTRIWPIEGELPPQARFVHRSEASVLHSLQHHGLI